jgi:hypothetical protein
VKHTFLFCSWLNNLEAPSILEKACGITKKIAFSMGLELRQKKKFLKQRKWPPREPVMQLGCWLDPNSL